jgi:hypothetical protein
MHMKVMEATGVARAARRGSWTSSDAWASKEMVGGKTQHVLREQEVRRKKVCVSLEYITGVECVFLGHIIWFRACSRLDTFFPFLSPLPYQAGVIILH